MFTTITHILRTIAFVIAVTTCLAQAAGSFIVNCAGVGEVSQQNNTHEQSKRPSVVWQDQKKISRGKSRSTLPQVLTERATITKPDFIRLIPERNFAGIFIIKFVEGSHIRYRNGFFQTSKDQLNVEEIRRLARLKLSVEDVVEELGKINQLALRYWKDYRFFPISTFPYSARREDPNGQFREKESLERASGQELADLDLYFTMVAKDFKDLEAQQEYMNALNRSPIIEDVHAAFSMGNAEVKTDRQIERFNDLFLPLDTPDFSSQQGYLSPAAEGGIDARYAWTRAGGTGRGVKVIDVEYDWQTDHEDFASTSDRFWGGRGVCSAVVSNTDHGTAVMGVLNAPHNTFGVKGIAPDIRYGLASVCRAEYLPGFFFSLFSGENVVGRTHNIGVAATIENAGQALALGDVLLIEQHVYGPQGEWLPVEYYQESFDAIARATARGIVVVEAAGNGGMDLDDARYSRRFDPTNRYSGALLVGASKGAGDHDRASFSNFGTRLDVHGWGGGVVTLGYGDVNYSPFAPLNGGNVTRYYTRNFSGTSSASPIVTGAVASIQGARRAGSLEPLNSSQLSMLFGETGTPQGAASSSQRIGPLPDLHRAIDRTLGAPVSGGFTGPGTYFIQARHSEKFLDINIAFFSGQLDGRPLAQFDNHNGDNQKFIVELVSGPFVRIRAKHSGKCLDASRDGLQQMQCDPDSLNQQFTIEPVLDSFKIKVRQSGLVFDVEGARTYPGARVIQYPSGAGDNQLFRFIPTR